MAAVMEATEDSHKTTLTKQAALWFRIHGLLDRMLAALKTLAALMTKMESRSARGPEDYEPGNHYGGYYGREQGPAPTQEPSWQSSLLGKIIAPLIVLGIPAILAALWTTNSRLSDLRGDNRLVSQKQDAMEKHLESTDKHVEAIERELWPHKH